MTLRHLEIFRAVCRKESVTAAAEQLNMTQPAVSQAIRELESFYGVRLFERMNRRVYITESGRTLLQYADTIVSQFQDSVQVLREVHHGGTCRFGVHVTFGETRLSAVLKQLQAGLPQIALRAFVGNSRKNEDMLLRNELDFAVVDNVTLSPSLTVQPLYREAMAAVCCPAYRPGSRISLEELAREQLLLREPGSGTRSSIDGVFQAIGTPAAAFLDSASTSALLECARQGLGITILARSLVEHDLQRGTLKELSVTGGFFFRKYYLACHKNKYLTDSTRQVIQILRECCEDIP